ncbi:uncharacterized protein N7484_008196 [Penicillium longicatenatum]|uniref:uncharacterized protein n=1 Tax=Penicillium longicatenatum TaxID=1561947 RepID=UPI002546A347|nr:uncharacterized protein N7484_008196 [Penicillium longicatenatum]KAJ5640334.1 hypothetical protein N7484_008196 [Penicillium longicatenatum]
MDEIADIIRELGRQQGENTFYRICYGLLKRLQDTLSQASDDLLFHCQHDPYNTSRDFDPIHQIAEELKTLVEDIKDRERMSLMALEEFFDVQREVSVEQEHQDFNKGLS